VRKLKILLLVALVVSLGSIVGCSKSNNNSSNNSNADTVYYSGWVTLATTYVAADSGYEMNIAAPKITQAILDQGVILSYVNISGTVLTAQDFGFYPDYTVGNINVFSAQGDATGSGIQFRYVIIPGKVAITAFPGMPKDAISKMSFTDVTKVLSAAAAKQSGSSQFNP
jgi:hypothetical protein